MSPRFQPDLAGTTAGLRVYDRGDYELKCTGVKPIAYFKEPPEDSHEEGHFVSGASLSLEIVGRIMSDGSLNDEFAGESCAPFRCYIHTDKAWPITKRTVMAFLGYSLDEEDQFNSELAANLDLMVDGGEGEEEAVMGNGWKQLEGKRARVTLSKRSYQGREQQDFGSFMPIR